MSFSASDTPTSRCNADGGRKSRFWSGMRSVRTDNPTPDRLIQHSPTISKNFPSHSVLLSLRLSASSLPAPPRTLLARLLTVIREISSPRLCQPSAMPVHSTANSLRGRVNSVHASTGGQSRSTVVSSVVELGSSRGITKWAQGPPGLVAGSSCDVQSTIGSAAKSRAKLASCSVHQVFSFSFVGSKVVFGVLARTRRCASFHPSLRACFAPTKPAAKASTAVASLGRASSSTASYPEG